ncbi:MAG: nucleoside hydrolase [Spirosoma sp.]|nr:nucleoside hydrolase [Spirosoma sp.]
MNRVVPDLKRTILLAAMLITPMLGIAQPKSIWIDTDIHLGRFGRDVDDGLAVMQAIRSNQVVVKGISLTLAIDHGYKVTSQLLERCGKSIPLYKGASSYRGLGKETDAVKALTEALRKERLSILVLGPATNIASVLLLHPELQQQIVEVVFCGGRQPGKVFNPATGRINLPDTNFERDPAAFKLILETNTPVVLAGYEASSSVYFNKEDIQFLKESPNETDQWLYKKLRHWQKLWRIALGSKRGFIPFDAVTAGWLTSPEYFLYYKDIPVAMKLMKNDSKLFRLFHSKKLYLQVSYNYLPAKTVQYCYGIQPEYKQVMLQSLRGQSYSDTFHILTTTNK